MDYKRYFPTDDSLEGALLMLKSLSPDMQASVISLVTFNRPTVEAALSDSADDQMPRLNALFSKRYFKKFHQMVEFYYGFSAVAFAGVKSFGGGANDYKNVLATLFDISPEMARNAGKQIDTYDVIGGAKDSGEKEGILRGLAEYGAEGLRRVANHGLSAVGIPYQIQELQNHDFDRVYEFRALGRYVFDFSDRVSDIRATTLMAMDTGLFHGHGFSHKDDPGGDVFGDVVNTVQRAGSRGLPAGLMGMFAGPQGVGISSAVQALIGLLSQAGLNSAGQQEGQGDPVVRGCLSRVMRGDLTVPERVRLALPHNSDLHQLLQGQEAMAGDLQSYADGHRRAMCLGDVFADAWAKGDVETMVHELGDIYSCHTTGDPLLDERIAMDVQHQLDAEGASDAERGGWFTKYRTKHAMRRAKHKFEKARAHNMLVAAKDLKNRDWESDASTQADPAALYNQLTGADGGGMDGGTDPNGGVDLLQGAEIAM